MAICVEKILNQKRPAQTAADGRHNNQPKMGGCGGEEDEEEGCKGTGAGCQCAVSVSKEGEMWQRSASVMIAH